MPENEIQDKSLNDNNDGGNFDNKLIVRDIESEMKNSFIQYSMAVIVSRALTDVSDG